MKRALLLAIGLLTCALGGPAFAHRIEPGPDIGIAAMHPAAAVPLMTMDVEPSQPDVAIGFVDGVQADPAVVAGVADKPSAARNSERPRRCDDVLPHPADANRAPPYLDQLARHQPEHAQAADGAYGRHRSAGRFSAANC